MASEESRRKALEWVKEQSQMEEPINWPIAICRAVIRSNSTNSMMRVMVALEALTDIPCDKAMTMEQALERGIHHDRKLWDV